MKLPPRYDRAWGSDFWDYAERALKANASILDLGGGRTPTLSPEHRPTGTRYVGMDIALSELHLAPPDSYDETIGADAELLVPQLVNRFDLILSWQVLEHIRHLDRAAVAFYQYLRPGGWFVAMLSGRNAVYALANRMLPATIGAHLVARLRRRPLETVFSTHYDHCSDKGLQQAFAHFDDVHVFAYWHAADYFDRIPPVQRLYLAYENWAARSGRRQLATHYVVAARKATADSGVLVDRTMRPQSDNADSAWS